MMITDQQLEWLKKAVDERVEDAALKFFAIGVLVGIAVTFFGYWLHISNP